jgi:hypothetical protein
MPKSDTKFSAVKSGVNKLETLKKEAKRRFKGVSLKRVAVGSALGVVVVVAVTALVLTRHQPVLPDLKVIDQVETKLGVAPTLDELKAKVAKEPKNAEAQLDLAHAYFDSNQHGAALGHYDLALKLDPKLASDRVVKNLVACAGTAEQNAAFAVISKYKLTGAEEPLHRLHADYRYPVRSGAVATLDRLGKANHDDWERMWIADLKEKSCDVRKNAVEKLGQFGDRASVVAIKAAKKHDDAETRWWQFSCLGGKADDAQKQILARR